MCNHIKESAKTKGFWIWFIVFALMTGVFLGLGLMLIHFDNVDIAYQQQVYKPINVTVDGYTAINVGCGCPPCSYPGEGNPGCFCAPDPYTGVILLKYVAKNSTYYDEKRVVCGTSYSNAITNAQKYYPKNNKLIMYYNTENPDAGVVFNVDYGGYYWVGIVIFFICAGGSFCMIFVVFIRDRSKSEHLDSSESRLLLDNEEVL